MPSAVIPLTKYDITEIAFLDATGSPVDLPLVYMDKSFSADRMVDLREEIAIYAGETYLGSRNGATIPISGAFSTYMTSVTSADVTDAAGNPWDFIARTNGFSANTNAGTTGYDHPMITLRATMATNSVTQILSYAKTRLVGAWSADEPNKIDWTFVCRGGVTLT